MRVLKPFLASVEKKGNRYLTPYPLSETKNIKSKNNLIMGSLLALASIYSPIEYNYEQPRSSVPIDHSIYTPSAPIKNAQDLLRKSVMKKKDNLLLREDNDDKNAFV